MSNNPVWKQLNWEQNNIQRFPSILLQFVELQTLILHGNYIKTIPNDIYKLKGLQVFDLSNNSIASSGLPKSVLKMTALHANHGLNIKNNPISSKFTWNGIKTSDTGTCLNMLLYSLQSSLKSLDLSNGEFRMIQVSTMLRNFTRLEHLNVSGNSIGVLQYDDIELSENICTIDFSNNPIKNVDEMVLFKFQKLTKRECVVLGSHTYNGSVYLRNLQDGIFVMDVSHKHEYPLNLVSNYFLTNRDIYNVKVNAGYKFKFISSWCSMSMDMTSLSLQHMRRNNADFNCISKMKKLSFLAFSHINLPIFPKILGELDLITLSARSNGIEQFDDAIIGKWTNLRELKIYNNGLKHLNTSMTRKLRVLEIQDNLFETIDLSNLKLLKFLSAHMNKLKSIDVYMLSTLEKLYVSWNQLSTINTTNLYYLTELSAANNQIRSINISTNHKLRRVNLARNKLKRFPDVSNLKDLLCLDVSHNDINDTLPNLEYLQQLEFLSVYNNSKLSYNVSNILKQFPKFNYVVSKEIQSCDRRGIYLDNFTPSSIYHSNKCADPFGFQYPYCFVGVSRLGNAIKQACEFYGANVSLNKEPCEPWDCETTWRRVEYFATPGVSHCVEQASSKQ